MRETRGDVCEIARLSGRREFPMAPPADQACAGQYVDNRVLLSVMMNRRLPPAATVNNPPHIEDGIPCSRVIAATLCEPGVCAVSSLNVSGRTTPIAFPF